MPTPQHDDSATSGGAPAGGLPPRIRWTAFSQGLVKNLSAFDKKRHTVPDAVNPATTAFIGRLFEAELATESEAFFQKARAALGFKRADISRTSAGGNAIVQTRAFTLEWDVAQPPDAPDTWRLSRTLHSVRSLDLLETPEFDALLGRAFTVLEFRLEKPVRVEAVIDVVEALDPATTPDANAALTVEYPSDCSRCCLKVPGVPAKVVFTGDLLCMEFDAPGSPRELVAEFERTRRAFALVRDDGVFAAFA